MAENEVTAVIAQLRKTMAILKEGKPLTPEQRREVELMEVMFTNMVSHRGPGYAITKEQALELATLMNEFRTASHEAGIGPASERDIKALAEQMMNAPPPTKN